MRDRSKIKSIKYPFVWNSKNFKLDSQSRMQLKRNLIQLESAASPILQTREW